MQALHIKQMSQIQNRTTNRRRSEEKEKITQPITNVLFCLLISLQTALATWAKSIVFNHYVLNAINDEE